MKRISDEDRIKQIFVGVATKQEADMLLHMAEFIVEMRFPKSAAATPARKGRPQGSRNKVAANGKPPDEPQAKLAMEG